MVQKPYGGRRPSAFTTTIKCLGVAALLATGSAANADSLDRIKDEGKLQVCGVDGLLPYSSSDASIPGFEVEIARKMGEHIGVEIEYVWVGWDALIPALTSDRCDAIINGLFITEERKAVIDFSDPYYASGETILVRKDDDTVRGLEDLHEMSVGVLAGSVTVNLLESKGVGKLQIYPDQNTIVLELNNKRIDAAYLEAPSAAWVLRNDPSLNIRMVDTYVPAERFNAGVGLRKGEDELKAAFNAAIAELRGDDTIKTILAGYQVPYFPISE